MFGPTAYPPTRPPQDIFSKIGPKTTKDDLKPIGDYVNSIVAYAQDKLLTAKGGPLSVSAESPAKHAASELGSLKVEIEKALSTAPMQAKTELVALIKRIDDAQSILGADKKPSPETFTPEPDESKKEYFEPEDSEAAVSMDPPRSESVASDESDIQEKNPKIEAWAIKIFSDEYQLAFPKVPPPPLSRKMEAHFTKFIDSFTKDYKLTNRPLEGSLEDASEQLVTFYRAELQTLFSQEKKAAIEAIPKHVRLETITSRLKYAGDIEDLKNEIKQLVTEDLISEETGAGLLDTCDTFKSKEESFDDFVDEKIIAKIS